MDRDEDGVINAQELFDLTDQRASLKAQLRLATDDEAKIVIQEKIQKITNKISGGN